MAFNVWFIIWPNQKKVLGIVECAPEDKTKTYENSTYCIKNKYFASLPMLLTMVVAQNLY